MTTTTRLSPTEVRERMDSGDTVLVCAYEDEEKCRDNRLEGALTYQEFQQRLPTMPKDQGIAFY